jgi:hypothetical protein
MLNRKAYVKFLSLPAALIFLLCAISGLSTVVAQADDLPCSMTEAGGVAVPSIDCLNRKLKKQAEAEQLRKGQKLPAPTGDALADPDSVGNSTDAAARQRFGPNFGISPTPYRPSTLFQRSQSATTPPPLR